MITHHAILTPKFNWDDWFYVKREKREYEDCNNYAFRENVANRPLSVTIR